MRLNIDTRGKRFVVTKAVAPKTDQSNAQRTDKESGLPMWATQVACIDEDGGDVVNVTTVGEKPDVQVDDDVVLIRLVAIPWNTSSRGGVAYRADEIRVEDSE